MTDWNKRLWGDPDASRRNILQRFDRRGPHAPEAKDDPVTGFLKGLSKYGPKGKAEAADSVDTTIAKLGMSREKVTDADAALLHLYDGDSAMQTAILARVRDRQGAAGLVDEVAAAAGGGSAASTAVAPLAGTTGADAVAVGEGPAWTESALASIATLEPAERTAVLAGTVRGAAERGATTSLDDALANALRATPVEIVQEALADSLEHTLAARGEAVPEGTAVPRSVEEIAAGDPAVGTGIFAPKGAAAAAEAVVTGDEAAVAASHAAEAAPTAVEHADELAPALAEAVGHAEGIAPDVASVVDLAAHAGAGGVGEAAEAVTRLAGHAGAAAGRAGEVVGHAAEAAHAGVGRLWTLDDIAREAMRLGPYVRA